MNNQGTSVTDLGFDPADPKAAEKLAARWGKPLVLRDKAEIKEATCGLISAKTCSNRDCAGTGPKGKVRVGKRVAYPALDFFAWFVAQMNRE
jgi:hypothetical protein